MEAFAPVLVLLLVAVVFTGVITLAVASLRRARRLRTDQDALVPLAQRNGWHYQARNTGYADRFTGGPLPRFSRNLRVSHLVTGTVRGRPFGCFQYRRRAVGSGGRGARTTYETFRVFAVGTSTPRPTVQVARAGLGGRLLDRVGAGGVEVGDPEFDAAFRITGDATSARQALGPQLRRWLLDDPRAARWPLRFERDELVTWQPGPLTASSVESALEFLCDVLDRVPAPRDRTPS